MSLPVTDFDVVSTFAIQRRNPWPIVRWVGKKDEELVIARTGKVGILSTNGRTRKIRKIDPLMKDVQLLGFSKNARHMIGLLTSGDLFVWTKDDDSVQFISGLDEFRSRLSIVDCRGDRLCVADSVNRVVVLCTAVAFVWERESHGVGRWTKVKSPFLSTGESVPPSIDRHPETAVDAGFADDYGFRGVWCYADNEHLRFVYLSLVWSKLDSLSRRRCFPRADPDCNFNTKWQLNHLKLRLAVPGGVLPDETGSLSAALSPTPSSDAVLALAVNQKVSHANRVLFLTCPWNRGAVETRLIGSGAPSPMSWNHRWFWTTDMKWTVDSLLLLVLTRQGSLFVLTPLGEPLMLRSEGQLIGLGPAPFLCLHPLVVKEEDHRGEEVPPSHVPTRPRRQLYCVSVHPRDPSLLLVSDGYMVTVLMRHGAPCRGDAFFRASLVAEKIDAAVKEMALRRKAGSEGEEALEALAHSRREMLDIVEKLCADDKTEAISVKTNEISTASELSETSKTTGSLARSSMVSTPLCQSIVDVSAHYLFLEEDRVFGPIKSAWGLLASYPSNETWTREMANLADILCRRTVKAIRHLLKTRANAILACFDILQFSLFDVNGNLKTNFLFLVAQMPKVFIKQNQNNLDEHLMLQIKLAEKILRYSTQLLTSDVVNCLTKFAKKIKMRQKDWSDQRSRFCFIQWYYPFLSVKSPRMVKNLRFFEKFYSGIDIEVEASDVEEICALERCHSRQLISQMAKLRNFLLVSFRYRDLSISFSLIETWFANIFPEGRPDSEPNLSLYLSLFKTVVFFIANLISNIQDQHSDQLTLFFPSSRFDAKYIFCVIHKLEKSDVCDSTLVFDLFLLTGRLDHASAFAFSLGDWKTSFGVALAADFLKNNSFYSLQVSKYVVKKLLKQSVELLTSSGGEQDEKKIFERVSELLLIGKSARVPIVPWTFKKLTSILLFYSANIEPFVCPEFYLPSPPVFMPQIVGTDGENIVESSLFVAEAKTRKIVSFIVRLIIFLFQSLNLTHILTRSIKDGMKEFTKTCFIVDNKLSKKLESYADKFNHDKEKSKFSWSNSEISMVFSEYRSMLTVVWLFHVRDQVSYCLRKLGHGQIDINSERKLLKATFLWAQQFLPFSIFIQARPEIELCLLSIIQLLGNDKTAAVMLAQVFHDQEDIEPSVEEKLEEVLKLWRSFVKVKAHHTDDEDDDKNLNVVFLECCSTEVKKEKQLKKSVRGYQNFVFDPRFPEFQNTAFGAYPHERFPHFFVQLFEWFDIMSNSFRKSEITLNILFSEFLKPHNYENEFNNTGQSIRDKINFFLTNRSIIRNTFCKEFIRVGNIKSFYSKSGVTCMSSKSSSRFTQNILTHSSSRTPVLKFFPKDNKAFYSFIEYSITLGHERIKSPSKRICSLLQSLNYLQKLSDVTDVFIQSVKTFAIKLKIFSPLVFANIQFSRNNLPTKKHLRIQLRTTSEISPIPKKESVSIKRKNKKKVLFKTGKTIIKETQAKTLNSTKNDFKNDCSSPFFEDVLKCFVLNYEVVTITEFETKTVQLEPQNHESSLKKLSYVDAKCSPTFSSFSELDFHDESIVKSFESHVTMESQKSVGIYLPPRKPSPTMKVNGFPLLELQPAITPHVRGRDNDRLLNGHSMPFFNMFNVDFKMDDIKLPPISRKPSIPCNVNEKSTQSKPLPLLQLKNNTKKEKPYVQSRLVINPNKVREFALMQARKRTANNIPYNPTPFLTINLPEKNTRPKSKILPEEPVQFRCKTTETQTIDSAVVESSRKVTSSETPTATKTQTSRGEVESLLIPPSNFDTTAAELQFRIAAAMGYFKESLKESDKIDKILQTDEIGREKADKNLQTKNENQEEKTFQTDIPEKSSHKLKNSETQTSPVKNYSAASTVPNHDNATTAEMQFRISAAMGHVANSAKAADKVKTFDYYVKNRENKSITIDQQLQTECRSKTLHKMLQTDDLILLEKNAKARPLEMLPVVARTEYTPASLLLAATTMTAEAAAVDDDKSRRLVSIVDSIARPGPDSEPKPKAVTLISVRDHPSTAEASSTIRKEVLNELRPNLHDPGFASSGKERINAVLCEPGIGRAGTIEGPFKSGTDQFKTIEKQIEELRGFLKVDPRTEHSLELRPRPVTSVPAVPGIGDTSPPVGMGILSLIHKMTEEKSDFRPAVNITLATMETPYESPPRDSGNIRAKPTKFSSLASPTKTFRLAGDDSAGRTFDVASSWTAGGESPGYLGVKSESIAAVDSTAFVPVFHSSPMPSFADADARVPSSTPLQTSPPLRTPSPASRPFASVAGSTELDRRWFYEDLDSRRTSPERPEVGAGDVALPSTRPSSEVPSATRAIDEDAFTRRVEAAADLMRVMMDDDARQKRETRFGRGRSDGPPTRKTDNRQPRPRSLSIPRSSRPPQPPQPQRRQGGSRRGRASARQDVLPPFALPIPPTPSTRRRQPMEDLVRLQNPIVARRPRNKPLNYTERLKRIAASAPRTVILRPSARVASSLALKSPNEHRGRDENKIRGPERKASKARVKTGEASSSSPTKSEKLTTKETERIFAVFLDEDGGGDSPLDLRAKRILRGGRRDFESRSHLELEPRSDSRSRTTTVIPEVRKESPKKGPSRPPTIEESSANDESQYIDWDFIDNLIADV